MILDSLLLDDTDLEIIYKNRQWYPRPKRKQEKVIVKRSPLQESQAIKKLSTIKRMAKKSQNSNVDVTSAASWPSTIADHEELSLSWSLASLDTKSVDTYVTYVVEGQEENESRCCCCKEHEENQKNENRENEMII